MKKISIVFLLFLVFPVSLFSHTTHIRITDSGHLVSVSLRVDNFPESRLVESIEKGYRIAVEFEIQVYKKIENVMRVFGDKLLAKWSLREEGWKDEFNNVYVIQADGERSEYAGLSEFLAAVQLLEMYDISGSIDETEGVYVLARTRVYAVELIPPLGILSPFLSDVVYTSDWERKDIN